MNIGVEECDHCAAQEAARGSAPPPPPQPVKRHAKAQYGFPSFDWTKARRGFDVFLVVILVIMTILLIALWGWPELLPW
jgi:hypothetical protein